MSGTSKPIPSTQLTVFVIILALMLIFSLQSMLADAAPPPAPLSGFTPTPTNTPTVPPVSPTPAAVGAEGPVPIPEASTILLLLGGLGGLAGYAGLWRRTR